MCCLWSFLNILSCGPLILFELLTSDLFVDGAIEQR